MTKESLFNVLNFIINRCDVIINNDNYKPDFIVQDTIEEIEEICSIILKREYNIT